MAERNVEIKKLQMRQDTAANWASKNPVLAAGEFGYDTTGDVTKIGDGKTAWNALPAFATTRFTFASAGWGDIARIAASGEASKYFHVGDEKTITLSTGEEVTFVILGFDHDDLTAGGKAPITIGMKNLLATTYPMNGSATNVGGWDTCVMRTQTMQTILSQLPDDLQAVIKPVDKKTTAGNKLTSITTSSDKLFLFSAIEIEGKNYPPANLAGCANEGEQYEYWRTIKDGAGTGAVANPDRIKYLSNGDGSAAIWWLRSPSPSIAPSFYYVGTTGNIIANLASGARGVCVGFCI